MNSKPSQSSKNVNFTKNTRFQVLPQIFQYQNSKDYQNQQFLLDGLNKSDQMQKQVQQKYVFTAAKVQSKSQRIQRSQKSQSAMQIQKPKQSYFNNPVAQTIDTEMAALDQQFQKIQKMVDERQKQQTKSPQKSLQVTLKQRQLKRYSQRGINLQSFLTIAPQIQNKSGRKTFDVKQIEQIKNKAEQMTDQISNNKKLQQSLQSSYEQKIKSQQIDAKINQAKKRKQRLTLNLYEIMGLMEQVQDKDKQKQMQLSNNTRKVRSNRLTIDVNSIAKMFETQNFQEQRRKTTNNQKIIFQDPEQDQLTPLKEQSASFNGQIRQNRHGQGVLNIQNLSEQDQSSLFCEKYFSQIDQRIQNLKKQNSKLECLRQSLLRQKKLAAQVGPKINPEQLQSARTLNEEYISQTKAIQQKTCMQKYSESMKIISSFNYHLGMNIYHFQADQKTNDNLFQTFFAKFKIGSSLVKIRRIVGNQEIEVRIKTSLNNDIQEEQALFDSSTLNQVFYNFIKKKLKHQKDLLQILYMLSKFYQKIKQLQVELQQLMDILNLSDFQLNSTMEQLSFKYELSPKQIYTFDINLLDILEDKSKKNCVSMYSRKKRQYLELPNNYRPYQNFVLYNEIDYIQQSFSVFSD